MALLVDGALLKSPMAPAGALLSGVEKAAVKVCVPAPSVVAENVKGLEAWLA